MNYIIFACLLFWSFGCSAHMVPLSKNEMANETAGFMGLLPMLKSEGLVNYNLNTFLDKSKTHITDACFGFLCNGEVYYDKIEFNNINLGGFHSIGDLVFHDVDIKSKINIISN